MTRIVALIIIVIAAVAAGSPLGAQTDTSFTYQGELKENGGIANGAFNMEFSLWDTASVGNQIGTTDIQNGVQVVEGKFTVELNFGANAFDNSNRWLEITVNGFTLSPRNPITRSPYSIQTRGIFVAENNNVGIGTSAPSYPLHVESDTESAIFGLYTGTAGSRYGVYGRTDSSASTRGVFGHASAASGFTTGVQGRSNSTSGTGVSGFASANSGLNYGVLGETNSSDGYAGYFLGRGYFSGDVQIASGLTFLGGSSSPMAYMFDTGSAHPDRMVLSHSPSFPTFGLQYRDTVDDFAFVGSGVERVRVDLNGSDAEPTGGGTLVVGSTSAANLAIDSNEIMARNNDATSTLFLNTRGGDVSLGEHQIHPAHAYGRIEFTGVIISASSNVLSARRHSLGRYEIIIEGGVAGSDILMVSSNEGAAVFTSLFATAGIDAGKLRVWIYSADDDFPHDGRFSFVIYRP